MDGLAIVQLLRQQGWETPVLVLSRLGKVCDRVRGLRACGDDYLTKPFAFFQAEDGIRAYKVTRVQTCALPIWTKLPTAVSTPPVAGTARGLSMFWAIS